jgi:predicted MFS family arabinose efflux permease
MLGVPAFFNMLFGVVISFTTGPFPLMSLFTGLWIVWVCTPPAFVLPFELTGVRPRDVAVVSSLVGSFSGLGLAAGPIVTGLVAHSLLRCRLVW